MTLQNVQGCSQNCLRVLKMLVWPGMVDDLAVAGSSDAPEDHTMLATNSPEHDARTSADAQKRAQSGRNV